MDYFLGRESGKGFDINDDGSIDIADLILLIELMIIPTPTPAPVLFESQGGFNE